jgi:hypothetical protein
MLVVKIITELMNVIKWTHLEEQDSIMQEIVNCGPWAQMWAFEIVCSP